MSIALAPVQPKSAKTTAARQIDLRKKPGTSYEFKLDNAVQLDGEFGYVRLTDQTGNYYDIPDFVVVSFLQERANKLGKAVLPKLGSKCTVMFDGTFHVEFGVTAA